MTSASFLTSSQAAPEDAFSAKLLNYESGEPIRLSRDDLRVVPSTEVDMALFIRLASFMIWRQVFIQKWSAPIGFRYYRNMLSDVISVTLCPVCNHVC